MKKSRFSEEQIIGFLKEAERGAKPLDICRQAGITEQTYYRWKAKYGGMEISEAQRLRALEDENRRLKQMVAEQALDLQALKAILGKNGEPAGSPRDGAVCHVDLPSQRASSLRASWHLPIGVSVQEPEEGRSWASGTDA